VAGGGKGAAHEAGMTKRILVVEDQADNLQILRDLLSSAGYEMIEAEDGLEGVRAAAAHRPDLILMDTCGRVRPTEPCRSNTGR
jgi:response regulator RpfG family c-di-GMP phosphodiesterase